MSTCTVPANQPIYQALLDKAASYPADKPYQAKAYKRAAESVLNYNKNFYDCIVETIPGIGQKIEEFIDDFVASNSLKPTEPTQPLWSWANYLESKKPVVYTAEKPRRSRRLLNKPKVQYFTNNEDDSDSETEDDDDDDFDEEVEMVIPAIKAYCTKKGLKYSATLVAEFNAWLPTADQIAREKYDYKNDRFIPRTKPEMVKEWAQYYSTSLKQQQKEKKLSKALIKYCEKNNIEYQEVMDDKFATWMADPANKKLITYTYKSSNGCDCSSCNPNSIKREVQEYTYNRSDTYCINKWFSTLKKTIVW